MASVSAFSSVGRWLVILVVATLAWVGSTLAADQPPWVQAMRDVHARGTGQPGVLMHLGDSITYSMAYFAPLQYADKAEMGPAARDALNRVDAYMKEECYLALMAYAEVIEVVVHGRSPSDASRTILGPNPPKPVNLPKITIPTGEMPEEHTAVPPPAEDWFPKAPPLPDPTGPVIKVDTVRQLYAVADSVPPGGTILIADGVYQMPTTYTIRTDDVTVRGESGDRTAVVLDFAACRHHEGIAISSCSGVTIADLTVQNVRQNGIKINSNLAVDRVTIHNVVSHNVWQRHIKGPGVPDRSGKPDFVEDCCVQYCLFYNDRPKQVGDEPWEDANPQMGFIVTNGVTDRTWGLTSFKLPHDWKG